MNRDEEHPRTPYCYRYWESLGCYLKTGRLCRLTQGNQILPGFVRVTHYREITEYRYNPYHECGCLKSAYQALMRDVDLLFREKVKI